MAVGAIGETEAETTEDADDTAEEAADETEEAALDMAEEAEEAALEVAEEAAELVEDGAALFGQERSKRGWPKRSLGFTKLKETSLDVAMSSYRAQ